MRTVNVYQSPDRKELKGTGKFHIWGSKVIECFGDLATQTVAIVEFSDGKVEQIHPDCLEFVDNAGESEQKNHHAAVVEGETKLNIDPNNTAILCDTKEKAKTLLTVLTKCGYNWEYGENVTNWERFESETCYFVKDEKIMYHARAILRNLACYRNMYNIVSFDDAVFSI